MSQSLPGAPTKTLGGALLSVMALLLSVAILLTGNGLQSTLIPIRANNEAFGAIEIGVLGASYFVGFTLGCLFGPALIGISGHIRAYLAMVSLSSVIALGHPLLIDPWFWWILRLMTGFCFAVLYIVIESWLNEQSTNATRGTVFSIYTAINLTMISVGQLLIASADPNTYVLFSICSIIVSLAAIPLAFTRAVSPPPVPSIWPRPGKLLAVSPVGFAGCVAVGLANGAFWSLGAVFAQDAGYSTFGIGLFMTAAVVGGALAQWPLGAISDRMDRRRVIVLAAGIAATAAFILSASATLSWVIVFAAAAVFGAGAFPVYALCVAHSNDHAEDNEFVELSSGLLLVFGVSAAIGPLIASVLRSQAGGTMLFAFNSVVFTTLVVFVLFRMTQRSAPTADERGEFRDSLIATETLVPLDTDQTISDVSEDEATDSETQKND